MENKGRQRKINLSLPIEVVNALQKYALETKGHARGMSEVAEAAIREYLENRGVVIAKMEKSENPLIALAPEPISA